MYFNRMQLYVLQKRKGKFYRRIEGKEIVLLNFLSETKHSRHNRYLMFKQLSPVRTDEARREVFVL